MQKKSGIDALGASVLIAFSALLGLNQVMVKMVNAGMHPIFQAGLRSACAFVLVLLFAWLSRKKLGVSDGSLPAGLLCGLLFGLEFIMLFIALDYTSVARASVLFYTMPFWLAIGAHFFIDGERLTPIRIVGLGLAFLGVLMALSRNLHPETSRALLGDVLCLIASFVWAIIALLARTTKLSRSRPEMQLLYQLGVSGPLLLGLALVQGATFRDPTPLIWGMFVFQVVVVVSVGFLSWFWVLSIYPAADMAVYTFLAPVFGVFFGWVILNERIGWNIVVALVLIAAGIVMVNQRPAQRTN